MEPGQGTEQEDLSLPPPAGGLGLPDPPIIAGPTIKPSPSLITRAWFIVIVAIAMVLVGVTLAVAGLRRYTRSYKTMEARQELVVIAKAAAHAYERDGRLCPSASQPVPRAMWPACERPNEQQLGFNYTSSSREWNADADQHAGFACLGYEMRMAQYYRYDYKATADSFTARADGCLEDQGAFEISGRVEDGHLVVDPEPHEVERRR